MIGEGEMESLIRRYSILILRKKNNVLPGKVIGRTVSTPPDKLNLYIVNGMTLIF